MSEIFFTADQHFNHFKIIEYCNRPFTTVEEMNLHIIDQWNKTVTSKDTVWLLGDVGFGSQESLTEIVNFLNGTKYLIMGNHDKRRSVTFWENIGFKAVYKKPIEIYDMLLSHQPQDTDLFNLHGHIHNTQLSEKFNKDTHFCVSVECLNYGLINYSEIERRFL